MSAGRWLPADADQSLKMPATSTPSPSQSLTPRSGAITSTTGDRHIPSSLRADGSLRKEIKIRPGYRPPEDVEVYKNRTAEAWKTRGTGGVPGAEDHQNSGADEDKSATNTTGKNAKRREARKRAKATGGEGNALVQEQTNGTGSKLDEWRKFSSTGSKQDWHLDSQSATKVPEPELDPGAEKDKQARNLKKKLRQARELREKKDKGENLLPEQFEKVIKIQELIRQLDSLGFDSEGVQKA